MAHLSCLARSSCLFAGALLIAVTSAVAFAQPGPDAAGVSPVVAKGQALLEKNCARCHAIGAEGESTHKDAPPFRVVVGRYAPDNLAEALAEGLISGHPDMPEFVFEPDDVTAIVTYLGSLTPQTK